MQEWQSTTRLKESMSRAEECPACSGWTNGKVAQEAQTWAEQKARCDAGKRLDLMMAYVLPSFNEDNFGHVHAKLSMLGRY